MNLFLKRIAYFFLFILLVYPTYLIILGFLAPVLPNLNYRQMSYGHMHTRIQETKNRRDVDILFLGSSQAYRGFDVRKFENSFNLGSSSQTPIQTELLLNRYLDSLNPKTIVYAVDQSIFSSDGVESSVDIIANDKNDLKSLKMAFNVNHLKTYNTLLFGYVHDLSFRKTSLKEPPQKEKDTYVAGGYVEREMEYFKSYVNYPPSQWSLDRQQIKAFKNILSMTDTRNIRLILVYVPITTALYQSFTDNELFDTKMKSYGEYHNFNPIVPLDDSLHFYDSHHLNQTGTELFNDYLMEFLK